MRRTSRVLEIAAAVPPCSRPDEDARTRCPAGVARPSGDKLAEEARRLRQLQLRSEAQAARCQPRRGVRAAKAEARRKEALAKASRYQAEFHRIIDELMNADEFERAMTILRELKRHRRTVFLVGPHF